MKRLVLVAALAMSACDREAPDRTAEPAPAASQAVLPGNESVSRAAIVIPTPPNQAELDRMILAGYTPHANHLHPPGVNKCPLTKGNEVVM
ncbi:MAG: hypothetical protein ACREB1_05755 [Sphingomicrobium sp.]